MFFFILTVSGILKESYRTLIDQKKKKKKKKFCMKDFSQQPKSGFLRIWSHLLEKSIMEN